MDNKNEKLAIGDDEDQCCFASSHCVQGRKMMPLMQRVARWKQEDDVGLTIRPTGGSDPENYGVYATRRFSSMDVIGGPHGIPASAVIDPVSIVRSHPTAQRALEAGAPQSVAFWLALAKMSMDADAAESRDESTTSGRTDDGFFRLKQHDAYLASLPREAPEPCSWSDEQRSALLRGAPLAKKVDNVLQMLREEYDRVLAKMSSVNGASLDVPFDVNGRGIRPSLLWARGVHISRSFPRSLLDAAARRCTRNVVDSIDQEPPCPILQIRLGGLRPPTIAYSGPETIAPRSGTSMLCGTSSLSDSISASDALGIMLPLYDLLDHKCGHPISWEAGDGSVRFRCLEDIEEGAQVWNNYGRKPNSELLFSYGFAIRDNPFDSVDGIMIGCRCHRRCDGKEKVDLHDARTRLLQEHDIPHKIDNGALLIGPFSLCTRLRSSSDGEGRENRVDGEEQSGDILPTELLFALSVVGMKSARRGPCLSPDELDMLQKDLEMRLEALERTEEQDRAVDEHSRAGFCAAYKDGQRKLLSTALAELGAERKRRKIRRLASCCRYG